MNLKFILQVDFFTREFQIVAERGEDINTLETLTVSMNSIFEKYKSLRPEGEFPYKAIYCDSPRTVLDAVVNKKGRHGHCGQLCGILLSAG